MVKTADSRSVSTSDLERTRKQLDHFAWLMDSCFRVPGLGWRFGIEALIGLVPGLGDIVGGLLALILLIRAVQFKLPKIVVARMILNFTLDIGIGMIPFIGDAFDFAFKSNTRNMKLFHKYAGEPDTSTTRHWVVIGTIIGSFLLVCITIVIGTIWILFHYLHW